MERRTLNVVTYTAVALAGGLALEAAPLLLVPRASTGWGSVIAFTGFVLAAATWATSFAIKAHDGLDEFQRERAKSAVYWGVTVGIVASAPIYAFVEMGGLQRVAPSVAGGKPLAIAFASGYGLAVVFIALGTCIAAAWLRRGQAEARR